MSEAPAADAIRVWHGAIATTLSDESFLARFGAVFIPVTVVIRAGCGLQGCVPIVLAAIADRPSAVSAETALNFWESEDSYRRAFDTLAERVYTLTHGSIYDSARTAATFAGAFRLDAPVYLFDERADWMRGRAGISSELRRARPTLARSRPVCCRTSGARTRSPAASQSWVTTTYSTGSSSTRQRTRSRSQGCRSSSRSVVGHGGSSQRPARSWAGAGNRGGGLEVRPGSSFNLQFARVFSASAEQLPQFATLQLARRLSRALQAREPPTLSPNH